MINNYSKADKNSVFEVGHYEIKEHLFAKILVERSEEFQGLEVEVLKTKIIANFGEAALDILKDLLKETDLQYFNQLNDIKSLFELSNYGKLCYSDQQIRRRFLSDLGFNYCVTLANTPKTKRPGLEMLIYMADAIAFLAKNKIQFIEDFSVLFSAAEAAVNEETKAEKFKVDIGNRIKGQPHLAEIFFHRQDLKELRIRDFSVALQEAAYCDLTSGSFKATIPNIKNRNFSTGTTTNYGEKAYWDIFFWLCPGLWLRRNVIKTNVTF